MNFKNIRIAKKTYTIYEMTPLTAMRVIDSLHGIQLHELKDTSSHINTMATCISFGVSGSGLFSLFKAKEIKRRILKEANFNELFDALQSILKMIPSDDITTVASTLSQLYNLTTKDNEK